MKDLIKSNSLDFICKSSCISLLLFLLVACGGGGGGGSSSSSSTGGTGSSGGSNDGSSNPTAGAVTTAYFVDAPVGGVNFDCGSTKGKTRAGDGAFDYPSNATCTFSVGKVVLGTLSEKPTDSIVTPHDIVGVSRLASKHPNVTAVAQVLQSLDDRSSSSQINIPDSVQNNLGNISEVKVGEDIAATSTSTLAGIISSANSGGSLVDGGTAVSTLDNYLTNANIDKTKRVENKKAPKPTSRNVVRYKYRYGWQNTDTTGCAVWSPSCTPSYFVDGCQSYNGVCTSTRMYTDINQSTPQYWAFPIKPSESFVAKYLGLGIGGRYPDFVALYDSTTGSWNPAYTPSTGEVPNTELARTTKYDIFFDESNSDSSGAVYLRPTGANSKTPGFQAYLGSSGASLTANSIYWIVVKYPKDAGRTERCLDQIGVGTSGPFGNGFAFFLMSTDGLTWEPASMIDGGICNTFLTD